MKTRDVRDLVRFDDDEARHEILFETGQLFSQVICLQQSQSLGPVGDPRADAVCLIVAGEVSVQVGTGRRRMKQWETVLVPGGEDLTLRNASAEPGVVLLIAAPPPGEAGGDQSADGHEGAAGDRRSGPV
jgi:mannose-6-phosphate isomerase-like protein (cupin superfamily)